MDSQFYEEYIRKHFQYHADGTITRNDRKNADGSLDKDGYLIIKIKGHQFKAHRVAWLLNYGSFPRNELDHKNRIKTDNRIENLRESNRYEQTNNATYKINPDTGVAGIYIDKTKGLKKKYTFKFRDKTYRFYSLQEAKEKKEMFKKLTAVQCELKAPKNQRNNYGGYNYRSCEDILEAVKPILAKYNASITLSDAIEQVGDRIYVKAIATFHDEETNSQTSVTAYAREPLAQKGMSDSQITGAASSYARKYALNGLLLIDDTKDADTDEYQNQQNKKATKAEPANTQPVKQQTQQPMPQVDPNVDRDLVPHGEGMTPKRIARLKKAQQITGKNDATVLATAHAHSFEEITEASYIAVMNLFLNLMTPEQKKEIEAI